LNHRAADVARCWAKYGLNLLAISQNRLLRLSDEDFTAMPKTESGSLILQNMAIQSDIDLGNNFSQYKTNLITCF
jgi:hypothetical protein